jgi:hypothetical protein
MTTLWSGLRKDAWSLVLLAIGLMSGIAAIFREWLSVFVPRIADSGRLFNACLITCFFLATLLVIFRQRMTIVGLENAANQSESKKANSVQQHALFGTLMTEGEGLAKELKRTHGDAFGPWLIKRRNWIDQVALALTDMHFPTEASAFRQAGEKDPDTKPGVIVNDHYWYDFYNGQLTGYRTKLQEIVTRRLL